MSKLIVCTGTLMSGGAERVLSILSKPFADAFEQVEYVVWLDDKFPEVFYKIDQRVKIIRISKESRSKNFINHLIWFRKYVKESTPDVILSFMVMINFSVMLSLLGTKVPLVLAERNDPRFFHHGEILRKIITAMYSLNNVKRLVMQTVNNKLYFPIKLQNKIDIIYNPLEIDNNLHAISLKTEKQNRIVSVARLENQKHQHILIEAFAKFKKNHPNYSLTIYGEGSMRESLEAQIFSLKLNDSVFLPGRTSNVLDIIKDAKMFVMTSLYEGMSNSLLEAMYLGLPCISTKVSGATDLIENYENGILVDIDDVNAIASAMDLLATDSDIALSLGEKATHVYEKLNVNMISEKWISCLKNTINN
ncbi:MAG: glycosyltransferase family 4 protein [Mediterranea massiliensis]|nr:glycosyltransferase family 4 protein [Mediterranea massiliensis]